MASPRPLEPETTQFTADSFAVGLQLKVSKPLGPDWPAVNLSTAFSARLAQAEGAEAWVMEESAVRQKIINIFMKTSLQDVSEAWPMSEIFTGAISHSIQGQSETVRAIGSE